MISRALRTTLDIYKMQRTKDNIHENRNRDRMISNDYSKSRDRRYTVGQDVYIRNYHENQDKWVSGIVMEVIGSNTCRIFMGTGTRSAHADQ